MKLHVNTFHLKVQKVEQICLFDLTWGHGQNLTVQVNYPTGLTALYQDWRQAYLNFYQSEQMRGRSVGGGIAAIVVDWHAELVNAETKMIYEFHRWLRSAELYEIRARIAAASQDLAKSQPNTPAAIQVFLTCAPIELDRFPWEAWEMGAEFATPGAIQLIRAPLNIVTATGTQQGKPRQGRTRILAVLGDDTGLNFKEDREAVRSLLPIAEVQFVGWQPAQTPAQVIQQVTEAIADPQGWDVLFFAGHSNETTMTGGELGIAPGVSIAVSEITPQLMAAKKRGLQVAIFNSCSGLSIAESLIDLGFSQVVVMREPIHNRVAQEFLVRFLQGLSRHLDVYESMMSARQFLRMEKSHTYPSASIVPSLFCHPGSVLFRIAARPWKQRLRHSLPTSLEAIALGVSLLLTAIPGVQNWLQDGRMFSQAVYRRVTAQIPSHQPPSVVLVQIDTASLARAGVMQVNPIDRGYLATIVDRLRTANAAVVGIDLLLDAPQKDPPTGDKDLAAAVRRAINQHMWLTFAAILEPTGELSVSDATQITRPNWTLQGYVDADPFFVELPDRDCREACPIAYLMALVQAARQEITELPQPGVDAPSGKLRTQLLDHIEQNAPQKGTLSSLLRGQPPFSLRPMIDFSLPPDRVYERISAWQLLDSSVTLPLLSQQVVWVAAGSDERMGIANGQPDRFASPSATHFWTGQPWLTGGETLAYMTHHLLSRHLILPIPDAWMIALTALIGKAIALLLRRHSARWSLAHHLQVSSMLIGIPIVYGAIGLQLYISVALSFPWLFPSLVFLAYVLPQTRRENHD